MITREMLKGFKESEYIDAILSLTSNSLRIRGYKAQRKQIEDIIKHLEEHSLTHNIDDSKDKSWDRLKVFVDNLPAYLDKLETAEEKLINLKKEEVKVSKGRNIVDLMNE